MELDRGGRLRETWWDGERHGGMVLERCEKITTVSIGRKDTNGEGKSSGNQLTQDHLENGH